MSYRQNYDDQNSLKEKFIHGTNSGANVNMTGQLRRGTRDTDEELQNVEKCPGRYQPVVDGKN